MAINVTLTAIDAGVLVLDPAEESLTDWWGTADVVADDRGWSYDTHPHYPDLSRTGAAGQGVGINFSQDGTWVLTFVFVHFFNERVWRVNPGTREGLGQASTWWADPDDATDWGSGGSVIVEHRVEESFLHHVWYAPADVDVRLTQARASVRVPSEFEVSFYAYLTDADGNVLPETEVEIGRLSAGAYSQVFDIEIVVPAGQGLTVQGVAQSDALGVSLVFG